jgi:hypothetical protein
MKEIKGKNGDNWNIIWISGILMALTVLIVVYGPRSFLVI